MVCRALDARPVAVRRTAVWALTIFDDAEALPALIAAAGKADGLLAAEIDRLLHRFTGVSMGGEGDLWAQWWAENEPTWKPTATRHESLQSLLREEDVEFYGIRSPSKRVVFVVDASGSMNKSAKGVHATTGKPRPGPTRWEAAQDELVRAIKGLAHDARFNIVMYGDEPETYRAPKELILATREAKAAAIEWVEAYEAEGTTALFPALRQGLAYRDDFAGDAAYGDPGVDTIFLLTDGTPTDSDGTISMNSRSRPSYGASTPRTRFIRSSCTRSVWAAATTASSCSASPPPRAASTSPSPTTREATSARST